MRTPGAGGFFAAAFPVRLGSAMQSLGIVLAVREGTGSFAAAGVVAGAFSLASAVASPQLARLMDRRGQDLVLLPCLLVYGSAMALLMLTIRAGGSHSALVACAGMAGMAAPQIGTLTAARWTGLLHDNTSLATAFALEAVSNESTFILGPALLGLLSAALSPLTALVCAWTLIVGGGVAFALQKHSAPATAPSCTTASTSVGKWLLRPGSVVMICVNVAIGMFFGAMQVSVSAFAEGHGSAGLAGPVYSAMSVAALASGFGFGLVALKVPRAVQMACAMAYLAAACLLPMTAASPTGLALALAAVGLGVSPGLVLSAVLAEAVYDKTVITQAFAWLNSMGVAGTALATTLAGRLVDSRGSDWGFAVAAGATATATLALLAGRAALAPDRTGARQ
ncbi:MFS transporter [Streptomyces sp. NPDC051976]|uniref:MFS transporter n=1 Tax=Streptomyces sp. NPDC051976 TaxID=3154947 RepID=UPI00342E0D46